MTSEQPTAPGRTVHAVTVGGSQIVRYARTGRWYLEIPNHSPVWTGRRTPYITRKPVPIAYAAVLAAQGTHHAGLPGGSRLDAAVADFRATHPQYALTVPTEPAATPPGTDTTEGQEPPMSRPVQYTEAERMEYDLLDRHGRRAYDEMRQEGSDQGHRAAFEAAFARHGLKPAELLDMESDALSAVSPRYQLDTHVDVEKYVVSCVPIDHPDRTAYEVAVTRHSGDRWIVVFEGWEYDADGDRNPAYHSLDDALALAREIAPIVRPHRSKRSAAEAMVLRLRQQWAAAIADPDATA